MHMLLLILSSSSGLAAAHQLRDEALAVGVAQAGRAQLLVQPLGRVRSETGVGAKG